MDKIQLLQARKTELKEAGKEIREQISSLVDDDSFVELSAFSFSKNEFYNQSVVGEGVVTDFATVDGYPFYVVAQNFKAMSGGVSKANCDKIVKCLDCAEKNSTPVIYLLNTLGVQIGEGVTVLEGMANVLLEAAASGRAVLASKIPGCQETFDEGVTGFGFEMQDVESLRLAIEKFATLPLAQKREMGKAGREKMETQFNRQSVVDKYLEQVNSVEK